MSVYVLLKNVTVAQTISNVATAAGQAGNPIVQPPQISTAQAPAQNQSYQVTVSSAVGGTAVSVSVQPVACADGINWANYGPIITATGTNTATALGSGANSPHAWYGAFVTAISGSGASATCLLSA